MNIPPYWVREERQVAGGLTIHLRGASYTSMEEARERMETRAALTLQFLQQELETDEFRQAVREQHAKNPEDGYASEVFEKVVEQVDGQNIITRNGYGAEVLNSTSLCMVDVDRFPDGVPFFSKLLAGIGIGAYDKRKASEAALMKQLELLCHEQEDLGARLYRTAAGWRVILQGQGLRHDSDRMLDLSRALDADPLYVGLCRRQGCWRARLTPKYYRLQPSPGPFPRRMASDTPAAGEEAWLAAYREACKGAAVCRLVESFGRRMESPILSLHDERTLALRPDLPLC